MSKYAVEVVGPTTLRTKGDGVEGFLIELDGDPQSLANRIRVLLEHANFAGNQAALRSVRLVLGIQ